MNQTPELPPPAEGGCYEIDPGTGERHRVTLTPGATAPSPAQPGDTGGTPDNFQE